MEDNGRGYVLHNSLTTAVHHHQKVHTANPAAPPPRRDGSRSRLIRASELTTTMTMLMGYGSALVAGRRAMASDCDCECDCGDYHPCAMICSPLD